MENIETLLGTIGVSDFRARVAVMASSGTGQEEASDTVAQQMVEEIHKMLRALLLMHGKATDPMTDAEATHAKR